MTNQEWVEIRMPKYGRDRFDCPHCNGFLGQQWSGSIQSSPSPNGKVVNFSGIVFSQCAGCQQYAFWLNQKLIWPPVSVAPPPEANMPDDVRAVYEKARSVLASSPEAAAALLRLALERLMPHLGEAKGSLNDRIGSLVKKGLRKEIQQSLDIVRVVGNNAVHPGTIDLKDDPATAVSLFKLVNKIVHDMITAPKELEDLYAGLPVTAHEGIERRDRHASNSTR